MSLTKNLHRTAPQQRPTGLIFGPLLSAHHRAAFSIQIFTQLVTGVLPPVKLPWPVVDIRDVAAAHVNALNLGVQQGRYLLTSGTLSLREIIDQVRIRSYLVPRGEGKKSVD